MFSVRYTYVYTNTGAGREIYILDSGLDLSNPTVAAQFGGRASVIWDVNRGQTQRLDLSYSDCKVCLYIQGVRYL